MANRKKTEKGQKNQGLREVVFRDFLDQLGYSSFVRRPDGTHIVPKVPGEPWEYFPVSFSDEQIIITLQMLQKAFERGQKG